MLRRIGLLDEAFFAYFGDVDLSFGAQLSGWRVVYEPHAIVWHQVGKTSSKLHRFIEYHSATNLVLLYTKNMPALLYWRYLPRFSLSLGLFYLSLLKKGALGTALKASLMSWLLLPRALWLRLKIQRQRVLSSTAANKLLSRQLPPSLQKLKAK